MSGRKWFLIRKIPSLPDFEIRDSDDTQTIILENIIRSSGTFFISGGYLRTVVSSPPKEFREKMMAALKDFFDEKLEEEPWSDLEATLWYVVQRLPLFKERRMMVKLRNISDDRENGEFNFKVFLCKRPEVYPTWNGESDEEEAPPEVYFCMKVSVKIVPMDSLQKSSGLLVAKMNPDELLVEGKPMPRRLLSFVKDLASKDYT